MKRLFGSPGRDGFVRDAASVRGQLCCPTCLGGCPIDTEAQEYGTEIVNRQMLEGVGFL